MTPDVQQLASQLLTALGVRVPCGTVSLNFNEGVLQSTKTEVYQRVVNLTERRNDGRRRVDGPCG